MTNRKDDDIVLDELGYNELRTMCKESDPPIPAKGNREELIEKLLAAQTEDETGGDETGGNDKLEPPVAPAHKPRKGEILFDVDDPFAAGALRSEGLEDRLPCRLDTKQDYAAGVLKNYVLRARGGCRLDLARPIMKVLDKLCPGWDEKPKPKTS